MKNQIKSLWSRFRTCDEGATLVEYGIALGLAVTLGAGALALLAGDVGNEMSQASSALKSNDGS